jgi:hypothetical protein
MEDNESGQDLKIKDFNKDFNRCKIKDFNR